MKQSASLAEKYCSVDLCLAKNQINLFHSSWQPFHKVLDSKPQPAFFKLLFFRSVSKPSEADTFQALAAQAAEIFNAFRCKQMEMHTGLGYQEILAFYTCKNVLQ